MHEGNEEGRDASLYDRSSPTVIATPRAGADLAAPSSRSLPPAAPGRYEIVALIGAGGMGRVYKARDPRLNRNLALKFIRDNDPALVGRFLREARAQARIDHEYICKVYEVGEAAGQPYIAMQYIEGQSLKAQKRALRFEEKVKVMRKVAQGLHAAHRQGLVHRDVKPANIMLERREDGEFHPYVMDFGLAREIEGEGQTQTGAIEGTPAYMAPEQLRGDMQRLDRRTDVYALGATLYELLSGKPPFTGQNSLELMLEALHEEPRPLRALEPSVPRDVETIVMKCLEKDPARRYDSARTFAEDLGRYLEGEPILARPPTLGYLAVKKARKHRALVVVSGAALVAVLGLGGMWARARAVAQKQAATAQEIGRDIAEMDLFLRYALALPPHDTEREKSVIRARMQGIEERTAREGGPSDGPAHYALGRGHLLLEEPEQALRHLQKALGAGYAPPEVHHTLGLAFGNLYERELDKLGRIEDPKARAQREREIEERYLSSALAHLKSSRGTAVGSPKHVDALVAHYEKRYRSAATMAAEAAAESPWFAEASKLAGDAWVAEARQERDRGEHEAALRDVDAAISSYRTVTEMMRSDPIPQEALAEAWILRMEIGITRGDPPRDTLEQAVAACGAALAIDARRPQAYAKLTRAHWRWGQHLLGRGEDPSGAFERALESAKEALRIDPADALTHDTVGNIHVTRAFHQRRRGADVRAILDRALESYESAIRIDPSFPWSYNDAGVALMTKASYESEHGLDPRRTIEIGLARLDQALEVDPFYLYPHTNKAGGQAIRATYELEHGIDPHLSARHALDAAAQGLRANPNDGVCQNAAAWANLIVAEFEIASGRTPGPWLAQASDHLQAALRVNAADVEAHQHLGTAHALRARHLLEAHADATEVLREGRAALERATEIDDREPVTKLSLGKLELLAARNAAARGEDVTPALDRAAAALAAALELSEDQPEAWVAMANLHRARAEQARGSRKRVEEQVRLGIAAAERALAAYPRKPEALAAKGALDLALARALPPGAKRKEAARRARAKLEEALRENPLLGGELTPLLDEATALGS
jgi:serine/threonine-protein kinase